MTILDHNFAHVKTVELLWHLENYDLIQWLETNLEQRAFSLKFNHELVKIFVKWTPGTPFINMDGL